MKNITDKLTDLLISKRELQQIDDINYFLVDHKYNDEKLKKRAQAATWTMRQHIMVGALGGVSFALSLRRYMPLYFGTFSWLRLGIQTALICGLAYAMNELGLNKIEPQIKNIKYKLVKDYDPALMKYLSKKARTYHYTKQYNLLRDVLSPKEYDQWRENRVGYLTDKVEEEVQ